MNVLKKIPYQLIFIPALSLLLSFCSNWKSKGQDPQKIRNYEKQLDSLTQKINTLSIHENTSDFIELYLETKRTIDLLPDTLQIQYINKPLVQMLTNLGAYDEAIKLLWKRFSILRDIHDDDSLIDGTGIYGSLGGLYKVVGKPDSVRILYRMAMNAAKFTSNGSKATHANNLGIYFMDQGILDSAMFYFQFSDSLYYTGASYSKRFHGSIKDNIASIHEAQGEFEKARKIYSENLSFYKISNIHFKLINAAISLANAEVELGNYYQADSLLRLVFDLSESLNYKNKHINDLYLFEVSAKYYSKTGNYKNAFTYTKKLSHLSDSIINLEKEVHRATNFQLAKSASLNFDNDLQVVRSEYEKDIETSRLRLWIIILIALGATIASTVLLFYYKQRDRLNVEKYKRYNTIRLLAEERLKTQNQENQLLDLELKYKNKDLADMAVSLSQKHEWATVLGKKVRLIETSKGHQRSREFKKLKNEILNQVYIDRELSLLNQNIDKLNKEFYDKLTSGFPGLTKNDIKLCSYFKLNLTNQHVAQLQNIDPSSVKVSRYRLKKKLGLGQDQNLDIFLQSL